MCIAKTMMAGASAAHHPGGEVLRATATTPSDVWARRRWWSRRTPIGATIGALRAADECVLAFGAQQHQLIDALLTLATRPGRPDHA